MAQPLKLQAPLHWGRRFLFGVLVTLASAGLAQPPVFATPGLGVAVSQRGAVLPIADFGAHYQVSLAAEPFTLGVRPDIGGDGIQVALGLSPDMFDRFGSPTDPLFGPASAYARDEKPGPFFLTDPACQGDIPTGFNILWADQREARGWPVPAILPDRSWVGCAAPSLDPEVSLIRPGQTLYMVVSDGEGADFLVLQFVDDASS